MRKKKAVSFTGKGHADVAPRPARTTVFLTDVLNDNLDALALVTGIPKGEHVRKALSEYIEKRGMDPQKRPKVTVTY